MVGTAIVGELSSLTQFFKEILMRKRQIYMLVSLILALLMGGWAYLDVPIESTGSLTVISPLLFWLIVWVDNQERRISKLENQTKNK